MQATPWQITIVTLMPEMYPGPLGCSLIGDALARGIWNLSLINLRDFGIGPHQKVDDSPAGGGAGMVLKPEVVDAAILAAQAQMLGKKIPADAASAVAPSPLAGEGWDGGALKSGAHASHPLTQPSPARGEGFDAAIIHEKTLTLTSPLREQVDAPASGGGYSPISDAAPTRPMGDLPPQGGGKLPQLIHFSPRGEVMNQALFRELITTPLILLCGRYEAIDERVLEKHRPREISLGDFVLTGGDIPAMALIDGCVRLLPSVVGKEASLGEESFGDGEYANLLEYPHYTKPAVWEGRATPEVLLSGHHKNIDAWRLEQAKAITKARRPDLGK